MFSASTKTPNTRARSTVPDPEREPHLLTYQFTKKANAVNLVSALTHPLDLLG